MAATFSCPSCGAPLETDGSEPSIHCEYCGDLVIVPNELRKETGQAAGPGYIPMGLEQSTQGAAGPFGMASNQLRQMMMAIRAGKLDNAASILQAETGIDQDDARQTVNMIADHLSNSSRILPSELASLMMGVLNPLAQSYNQVLPQTRPAPPARPRRRRGGLGCLVSLVIILLVIYFSYVSLTPSQLFGGITSGNRDNPYRQTALAPVSKISTAIAPVVGEFFSNSTPSP